jgi:hypothetical protein
VIVNSGAQTIEFANGSVGAPSITNSGDTNTGMFFPDDDTIAFAEGGAEGMRINSSGNVGIGTTSPYTKLQITKTAPEGTNIPTWYEYSTATAVFSTGDSTTANGYLKTQSGVYNAASTNNIDLIVQNKDNTYDAGFRITAGSGTGTTTNNGYLAFSRIATNGSAITATERMRIDASGNVLMGTNLLALRGGGTLNLVNSSSGQIVYRNDTQGAGKYWFSGVESSNDVFFVYPGTTSGGVYLTYGATSWTGNSDERLKTNLKPIENAIEKVSTLRAVTGRFKADEEGVSRSFLIAQDVQAVLPEAVNTKDDEMGTLGLRYTDVIPLLTAAIKEQQTIINDIKAELDNVKTELATLKGVPQ